MAFDPEAMDNCQTIYGERDDLHYAESKEAALDGADCLAICTEWKAFRSPDFEGIKQRLSSALIFDGRNLYDPQYMVALEIEYYAIGRGRSVQLSD